MWYKPSLNTQSCPPVIYEQSQLRLILLASSVFIRLVEMQNLAGDLVDDRGAFQTRRKEVPKLRSIEIIWNAVHVLTTMIQLSAPHSIKGAFYRTAGTFVASVDVRWIREHLFATEIDLSRHSSSAPAFWPSKVLSTTYRIGQNQGRW